MFLTARKALGTGLATALALCAIVAPGAVAQPIDRAPAASGAAASMRLVDDMRRARARDAVEDRRVGPAVAPSRPVDPGLDWDSAAIGAAAVLCAFAMALAGTAGLRRLRM